MTAHVQVRTVTDLGRDWAWLPDANVIALDSGLPAERLADALEEAASVVRARAARAAVA